MSSTTDTSARSDVPARGDGRRSSSGRSRRITQLRVRGAVVLPSDATTLADAGERTVVLDPDFERVTGLRGGSHKPERAWRRFMSMEREELPAPLRSAVERVVELARAEGDA